MEKIDLPGGLHEIILNYKDYVVFSIIQTTKRTTYGFTLF